MSTPVTVPASVAPEDHNEHVDRLKVGRLEADTLVVGSRGTPIGAPWQQTTTTLSAGTQGTGATNVMRFAVIGKTCHWSLELRHTTGAGTSSGTLVVSLPVRARTNGSILALGSGYLGTNSNGSFLVSAVQNSQSTCFFRIVNQTLVTVIDNTTASLANNTIWELSVSGSYEIE
jgi:hypothetical protein